VADVDRDALRSAHRFLIRGRVQGVGFRPFVVRLAQALGVRGWVRNVGWGVEVAVTGGDPLRFLAELQQKAPPAAEIEAIEPFQDTSAIDPALLGAGGEDDAPFAILPNVAAGGVALVPDRAVCPDCLAELFDPNDRRWRYPFLACTQCGPRYTVSSALPYERAGTTLADFPLCAACHAEFTDWRDRRFHAETTACPRCGPKLTFLDGAGEPLAGDPIARALEVVRAGGIVALKGLGGFQLMCDANNPEAVARLRARKRRPNKPFAVMALNVASLEEWLAWDEAARRTFESAAAPIVLVPLRRELPPLADAALTQLAPGLAWLGVMRPTTPLHYLLWHEAAGRPTGSAWLNEPHPLRLVMTSGNRSGEPIAADDAEAFAMLRAIVDGYLTHDRAIAQRADDSVVRLTATGAPLMIRRARGFVPEPVPFPEDGEPGVALGSDLKLAAAFVVDRAAYLTPYLGELSNRATFDHAWRTLTYWQQWLGVTPRWIAHDAHPDALSRRLAELLADHWRAKLVPVWHHPAHLAAVVVEKGAATPGPWHGWTLDGFGLGADGSAWGGELLRLEADGSWHRLAHLPRLPLPGGDRAAREPWRLAVAVLHRLGYSETAVRQWWERRGAAVAQRGYRWPQWGEVVRLWQWLRSGGAVAETTSMGRWFDAIAALLGLCGYNTYESEAAMRLESAAFAATGDEKAVAARVACARDRQSGNGSVLHEANWWHWVAEFVLAEPIAAAAAFHRGVAERLVAAALIHLGSQSVLFGGGGCWQNRQLVSEMAAVSARYGVVLALPERLPANDGGIALGQAWLAQRALERSGKTEKERSDVSGNPCRSGCALA